MVLVADDSNSIFESQIGGELLELKYLIMIEPVEILIH
jgi:hypothetical protein